MRGRRSRADSRDAGSLGLGTWFIRLGAVTRMILLNCGRIRANCLQKRLKFARERGREIQRFVGLRVGEGEMSRVEEVSLEIEGGVEAGDGVGSAVERVADDGMAEGLGMDTDLVRAAGFDSNFDYGEGAVGSG